MPPGGEGGALASSCAAADARCCGRLQLCSARECVVPRHSFLALPGRKMCHAQHSASRQNGRGTAGLLPAELRQRLADLGELPAQAIGITVAGGLVGMPPPPLLPRRRSQSQSRSLRAASSPEDVRLQGLKPARGVLWERQTRVTFRSSGRISFI